MSDVVERTNESPENLLRPKNNSLEDNYVKHDIGHAEVVDRLNDADFLVEEWGIDMREDDGDDGLIYDDRTDLRVYDETGDVIGLVDVKTKSNPQYMGRFNARHYDEYTEQAREHDVPAFVVMFQVDRETTEVHDEFVFPIKPDDDEQRVLRSDDSAAVDSFPDGNRAALVPHERRLSWWSMETMLLAESSTNHDD